MPERIDHAGESEKILKLLDTRRTDNATFKALSSAAQAYAMLALVEQQRIANLIALANSKNPILSEQVASDAATALIEHHPSEYGGWFELTPDIAAALGIKQEGESK